VARKSLEGGLGLDEQQFERFHAATATGLWAYLRRLGGDPALAEDILQESYVKFLGRVDPSSGEREKRAYLYRIATNLLHDRWRRDRRETMGLSSLLRRWQERGRDTDTSLRMDLESAFNRLEPRERAILWLAYVEGYEHREIADIVGVKEGSVRVMLFRARKKASLVLDRQEVKS
jgi:RNA polymerase sigma-70 factor, ECF subfamily